MAQQTIYRAQIDDRDRQTGLIAYVLYAAAIPLWPAIIAGVIYVYIKRNESRGTILENHLEWLIRTFWTTLFVGAIGLLLSFILLGIPILIALAAWYIYRIVKGAIFFWHGRDFEDPHGFF